MSESIPEYILKNPITAEVRQRRDTENDEYSYWHIPVGDKYKVDLPKEVFNELFVPVSVGLTEERQQQLRAILLAYGKAVDNQGYEVPEFELAFAEIVGLFEGNNK